MSFLLESARRAKIMSWSCYKEHIEQALLNLQYIDNATNKEQIEYYFSKATWHTTQAVKAWKEGLAP